MANLDSITSAALRAASEPLVPKNGADGVGCLARLSGRTRKRGGCRGGAGAPRFFGDATRDQTHRDRPPPSTAFKVRSPNKKLRGPSSTFRRSLLRASACSPWSHPPSLTPDLSPHPSPPLLSRAERGGSRFPSPLGRRAGMRGLGPLFRPSTRTHHPSPITHRRYRALLAVQDRFP